MGRIKNTGGGWHQKPTQCPVLWQRQGHTVSLPALEALRSPTMVKGILARYSVTVVVGWCPHQGTMAALTKQFQVNVMVFF